ncbi:unnamed protein product [Camellia sinensis]
MASSWVAKAASQATTVARLSSPRSATQAASLVQRRGLAGAADHHGPPKVNCWQDPMSPSKWKEEHFVIVSLSGWGLVFFSGYKTFAGGKNDKEEEIGRSITLGLGSNVIVPEGDGFSDIGMYCCDV